jgi:1,2-phenylacetyl-CoA epoxidase catalytic subunit
MKETPRSRSRLAPAHAALLRRMLREHASRELIAALAFADALHGAPGLAEAERGLRLVAEEQAHYRAVMRVYARLGGTAAEVHAKVRTVRLPRIRTWAQLSAVYAVFDRAGYVQLCSVADCVHRSYARVVRRILEEEADHVRGGGTTTALTWVRDVEPRWLLPWIGYSIRSFGPPHSELDGVAVASGLKSTPSCDSVRRYLEDIAALLAALPVSLADVREHGVVLCEHAAQAGPWAPRGSDGQDATMASVSSGHHPGSP